MNCKKVQEFILTGYSDGEIAPDFARQIDGHLKVCLKCRKFKENVEKTALSPFRNAQRLTPPDALWGKVRAAIVHEQAKDTDNIFSGLRDLLHTILIIRKPAFAFAAAVVIVFAGALFMKMRLGNDNIAGYLESQVDFMAYLDTDIPSNSMDYMNLDAEIENTLSRGRNFYEYSFV